MKLLLMLIIKAYWAIVPSKNRRKCIFRVSCSHYVYQMTKNKGWISGLKALRYRFLHCRAGFNMVEHPIDGSKMMVLRNGQVLPESDISTRLIHQPYIIAYTKNQNHV